MEFDHINDKGSQHNRSKALEISERKARARAMSSINKASDEIISHYLKHPEQWRNQYLLTF